MLGYPERAVGILNAAHYHARRRGHPFDLGFALTLAPWSSIFSASRVGRSSVSKRPIDWRAKTASPS
jgi:hypothetical protein